MRVQAFPLRLSASAPGFRLERHPPPPNNSLKPTPHRGVNSVLYATLARCRRLAVGRLNSGVRCAMNNQRISRKTRLTYFIVISCIMVLISSCAHQPVTNSYDPPGFFSGLLHGFLIFFSLIGSILTDVRIYAFPNSGGWYDVGFFIGAASSLGSAGASTRQRT